METRELDTELSGVPLVEAMLATWEAAMVTSDNDIYDPEVMDHLSQVAAHLSAAFHIAVCPPHEGDTEDDIFDSPSDQLAHQLAICLESYRDEIYLLFNTRLFTKVKKD